MEDHADACAVAADMAAGCLGMRITRLHRTVGRAYEQSLRPMGISLPQAEILAELMLAGGPVRPAALAARTMQERSTVSRSLALMLEKGWLTEVDLSPTGRTMTVAIAVPGIAVLGQIRDVWSRVQSAALATLGEDAVPTLDRWLASLADPSAGGEET